MREDGAARHWLGELPRRVWPEYEWLPLPFALPGFGDSCCGGLGCSRRCVWMKEHRSLWEREERKGGREEESRACEEEGGSFRQPHWTTAYTLQSFYSSLRKLSVSSPCSTLLLALSSVAAWPWPWRTPWSPCRPREDDRNAVAEEGERREEGTPHTLPHWSLMRLWKLINRRQHRRGRAERGSEWGARRKEEWVKRANR